MTDKKRDLMEDLKALDEMVKKENELFQDPFGLYGGAGQEAELLQGAGPAGFGTFKMPGTPVDLALYDKALVHGFRADYELTFRETEEGLEIQVAERRQE